MKLSEIKGDRCIDVIADLIEPVSNIASDKGVKEIFEKARTGKTKSAREKNLANILKECLPTILKTHKHDLIVILATIEGTEPEEYAKEMTLAKLMTDAMGILTDTAFTDFFFSQATTATSSESA